MPSIIIENFREFTLIFDSSSLHLLVLFIHNYLLQSKIVETI